MGNIRTRTQEQYMSLVAKIVQVVFWYILLIPTGIISLPIFLIWKAIAVLLIKWEYPDSELLSSFDLLFAASENHEENVLSFSLQFKGELDYEKIKQLLTENFASKYMRYRSYFEEKYNCFFWLEDKKFCIDNHLRFHPKVITTHEEMMAVMAKNRAIPFKPKRSLWHFDVYALDPKYDGGKGDESFFCLTGHIHHTLGDGYSLQYTVIQALFGENNPDLSVPVSEQKKPSIIQQIGGWFCVFCLFPYVVGELLFTKTNLYGNPGKSKRTITRSNVLSVDSVKSVKRALNVPFSSILMSCCSAGIQKHIERHYITVPENLWFSVTYRVWNVAKEVQPENRFISMFFMVPSGANNAKERLLLLHQSLKSLLNLARMQLFHFICSHGMTFIPSCFNRFLFNTLTCTLAMSTQMQRDTYFAISGTKSVLYKQNYMLAYPKSIDFAFLWLTTGDKLSVELNMDESVCSAEERQLILKDIEDELSELDKKVG